MWCGSLDGRGIWGRKDTWIYMVESFHPSPEIITTLVVNWLYYNTKKRANAQRKRMSSEPVWAGTQGIGCLGVWSTGDRERRSQETGKRLRGTASCINILLSAMGAEEGSVSYPRHSQNFSFALELLSTWHSREEGLEVEHTEMPREDPEQLSK